MNEKDNDARGITGTILAVGVAGSLILISAAAIVMTHNGRELSASTAALISTAIGAAVGAIATYLGGYSRKPDPTKTTIESDDAAARRAIIEPLPEDSNHGD